MHHNLLKMFSQIKKPSLIDQALKELLTEKEYLDLSLRWSLLERLYEGKSQRDISDEYRISLCKITRGSKILKSKRSICKKFIEVTHDK